MREEHRITRPLALIALALMLFGLVGCATARARPGAWVGTWVDVDDGRITLQLRRNHTGVYRLGSYKTVSLTWDYERPGGYFEPEVIRIDLAETDDPMFAVMVEDGHTFLVHSSLEGIEYSRRSDAEFRHVP